MPSTSDSAGAVVDCDLWAWKPSLRDLSAHLAESWREWLRVEEPATPGVRIALPESQYFIPGSALAAAATIEEAETLLRERLDATGLRHAILNPGSASAISGLASGLLGDAVARAVNEWTAERWLRIDDRLRGSIVVSAREPARAATEIRRAGANPRFAQVLLAYPPELLGHRTYLPILEAAVELGLPVALQAGGDYSGANPGVSPLGTLGGSQLEGAVAWEYGAQPHLVNLLCSGVFANLPELRVVFSGFGAGWLPPLLWRLDDEFRRGFVGLPAALDRLPSELGARHLRVVVTPHDVAAAPAALPAALDSVGGDAMLLFGTGPRREADTDPEFPEAWKGLCGTNALDIYTRLAA